MAITYGFYNSMNGDRKYDAVQLSSIFDGVIRDGVFQSIGGYLATKPGTGMQVIVSPGKAWFDHTWTVNDADLPLDISPSDLTLSRYDAVVLETDATKSVRENSIKVIKGTPASAPQKPTLTNEGDVHQHPLAYILVPGGSSSIQVQNIDIMVGKTECPFVTSILESVSIEALLEKWEGEFRVWFDDLQNQMAGDVATNLQNQITRNAPSVGDLCTSYNLQKKGPWLLCNGSEFDPVEYPDLFDVLSEGKSFEKSGSQIPGYFMALFSEDSALYCKLSSAYNIESFHPVKGKFRAPDLSNKLTYSQSSHVYPVLHITYIEGTWFLCGVKNANTNTVVVSYTKDCKNWKHVTFTPENSSDGATATVKNLVRLSDGWYFLGQLGTEGRMYYISDIYTSGTYSMVSFSKFHSYYSAGTDRLYVSNDKRYLYSAASAECTTFERYDLSTPEWEKNNSNFNSGSGFDTVRFFELGGNAYCVNHYKGNASMRIYKYGTSDHIFFADVGSGTWDIEVVLHGGYAYIFAGPDLYRMNSSGSVTKISGSLAFKTFRASILSNGPSPYVRTLQVDIDKGVYMSTVNSGSTSAKVSYNTPNILPSISSANGYTFIRSKP